MSQALLIDGRKIAALKRQNLKREVDSIKQTHGLIPSLHVILIGDNPASRVYVKNKQLACKEIGIDSQVHNLAEDCAIEKVNELIFKLNKEQTVHGILLQLPLPIHLDNQVLLDKIDPLKDVDGLHSYNLGRLLRDNPLMIPCTPKGCLELIQSVYSNLKGKRAIIIGRSALIGKPMAALLTNAHATVTLAHSHTQDLADLCRQADILVAAIGQARFVTAEFIKPRAIVIDVGINQELNLAGKTRLVGDVNYNSAKDIAGFITPVPGGVGPMTVSCLLENTVQAMKNQMNDIESVLKIVT